MALSPTCLSVKAWLNKLITFLLHLSHSQWIYQIISEFCICTNRNWCQIKLWSNLISPLMKSWSRTNSSWRGTWVSFIELTWTSSLIGCLPWRLLGRPDNKLSKLLARLVVVEYGIKFLILPQQRWLMRCNRKLLHLCCPLLLTSILDPSLLLNTNLLLADNVNTMLQTNSNDHPTKGGDQINKGGLRSPPPSWWFLLSTFSLLCLRLHP